MRPSSCLLVPWGLVLSGCGGCGGEDVAVTAQLSQTTVEAPFSPDALALIGLPTLTLTNASDGPLHISVWLSPNLTAREVTCDGVALAPQTAAVDALLSPSVAAAGALQAVAPGASVDLALAGVAFLSDGPEGTVRTTYVPAGPGACSVHLRYAYGGPDGDLTDVFHDPIDLDPIAVVLR